MFVKIKNIFITAVCAGMSLSITSAHAVMDSRFELDPQTLEGLKKTVKPHHAGKKRASRTHKSSSPSFKGGVYTVKSGDHLYKILMRDYGLSNKEAESFIEEIKIENNIFDIKRLKVGQKINIPSVQRLSDGSLKLHQDVGGDNRNITGSGTIPEQSFKLKSSFKVLSEQEAITRARDVWDRIIPPKKEQQKPLTLQASTFSLALDPERYPSFTRMDGGRILLDQNGTIPPLVKSLIEDKDASVRIVSEAPSGTKRFMSSLLEAAGFYSVEENFSMEFGVDPKLTVQADFKVEKTAESLIKQDIILINSGRTALPASIDEFLKKEGFSLYEPFTFLKPFAQSDSRTIYCISSKKQHEMIDSILSAFAVVLEKDRSVDVFAADNNGISLAVNAERYFEVGGQRYVVTSFDGNPINYTLFRILETKGYNVVILDAQDDFRKISEKIISRMKIKGVFAKYDLLQDKLAGYSLQLSGFKLDNALLPGGGIFLTDRAMDRIIRDVFTENGFNIENK
ncbi:MAG: LysM peptidoglycan-binding domain-containing protein [Geobacteraceae bacterium]|nr:LysM peptidoglycan-binding domain-containing protein [Geobacteraceae bacterium]NTW79737.1 LysM peptidoglycan-binding domain-containing protein [Geobacteraceae bacterium]